MKTLAEVASEVRSPKLLDDMESWVMDISDSADCRSLVDTIVTNSALTLLDMVEGKITSEHARDLMRARMSCLLATGIKMGIAMEKANHDM